MAVSMEKKMAEKIGRARAAAVLAVALCSPAAIAGPSEDIRTALDNWTKAFNSRDVGHVCDLFAGDLVAVYQGQPERNYDAICTLLSNSLRDREKSYHYSLDLKEILVSGDLGAVRLVWTLTVAREDGGVIETIDEPGIDVFRRQPDGVWKIARYLAFPIAPRP
jgi:steroid delta-isomerase